MQLISLNSLRNKFNKANDSNIQSLLSVIQEVLKAPGQIRRIDIATAYTDVEALKTLMDLIVDRGDQRSGVKVRIFLDYQNACKLADELKNSCNIIDKLHSNQSSRNKKLYKILESSILIKNGTTHSIQLFAIQLGTLFHSKAFVMETNTHLASCVGSVNFTSRGFITNEEIVITEILEQSKYRNTKNITKQVMQYMDNELSNSERVGKINFKSLIERRKTPEFSGLRELFLEGRLWYEDKEQTAFNFPLNLPEKLRIRDAEVQGISIPHIDSKLGSGLNVLRLIELDEKLSDRAPKNRWRRKYCIQTCLGLWAPNIWTPLIETALISREKRKKVWLDSVTDKFELSANEIQNDICSAYDETWEQLQKINGVNSLDRYNQNDLKEKVADWVERMHIKLGTKSFRTKVLTGVSSVDMPDLWSANPSDANKFELSFFDQLEYEISRTTKRSQIAKNFLKHENKITKNTYDNLMKVFIQRSNSILCNFDKNTIDDDDDTYEDDE